MRGDADGNSLGAIHAATHYASTGLSDEGKLKSGRAVIILGVNDIGADHDLCMQQVTKLSNKLSYSA